MNQVKPWYKSKTVWLAIIQGLAGILAALLSTNPELETIGYVIIVKSFLDFALRFLTDKPIN